MRNFVFWMAVLAIAAGSYTVARAQDAQDKKDEGTPTAAVAAAPAEEQKKESAAPAETAAAPAQEQKKAAAPEKAAAAAPAQQQPAQKTARQLNPANPWSTKVKAQAMALAKILNDEQAQKVAEIMLGFDMVRQIRTVEKDVGNAVTSCGKENPDLKEKMTARFDKWKKAVDPVLTQNEKDMNGAIKAKVAGDPRKIRDYFDLIEKYGDYEETILDKQAASRAQDCERLLSSMDRTQIALTDVLKKIKWPAAIAPSPTPEKGPQQNESEPAAGKNP